VVRLSSCQAQIGDDFICLAHAALQVANDFNTMGLIARNGDEATAHFLLVRFGHFEEAVWSIGRLNSRGVAPLKHNS
jgi:hypothetical protein